MSKERGNAISRIPKAAEGEPNGPPSEEAPAKEHLIWAASYFRPGRVALLSSFQAEATALIDMIARLRLPIRVVTIDTGRLPEETHQVIEDTSSRYGIDVEVLHPERGHLEALARLHGSNPFRRSVDLRKLCCHVRKVLPLERALKGVDAWVTGLRREQSSFRGTVRKVERDNPRPGLVKLNPLADWSEERVWSYLGSHGVPHHPLHDAGYPSIGCAPCSRPSDSSSDPRAGRWWWESEERKECGLHVLGAEPGFARLLEQILERGGGAGGPKKGSAPSPAGMGGG